jgi:hypothetical protein
MKVPLRCSEHRRNRPERAPPKHKRRAINALPTKSGDSIAQREYPLCVISDMATMPRDVRFAPESGHLSVYRACPLWAKSGHIQRSKMDRCSITSLTRVSGAGGASSPSTLAIMILTESWNLVGVFGL